jgi:hypothetical protein
MVFELIIKESIGVGKEWRSRCIKEIKYKDKKWLSDKTTKIFFLGKNPFMYLRESQEGYLS